MSTPGTSNLMPACGIVMKAGNSTWLTSNCAVRFTKKLHCHRHNLQVSHNLHCRLQYMPRPFASLCSCTCQAGSLVQCTVSMLVTLSCHVVLMCSAQHGHIIIYQQSSEITRLERLPKMAVTSSESLSSTAMASSSS